MLTGLGRLVVVVLFLSMMIGMFMWIGHNSQGFRGNVQSYIESQQDYPTFR